MTRALALVLLAAFGAPLVAADPAALVFGPPGGKLPEGAKFRLGRPHDHVTVVLAFSADGKTLAAMTNRGYTGGIDAPVDLWNVETGKHIRALRYHHTGVMAAAFSPDGSVVATSGIDNRLRFWDGKSGKDITKGEHINLTGHGYALCFSPDGKRLLVGSTKLEMYDVVSQKPVKKDYFAETAGNQFFHTANWSPKGKYIAAGCDGQGVRVWDSETGKLLYKLSEKYTAHRTRFTFSTDDKLVLLATWPDGQFSVFDAATGKEQLAVKPAAGEVPSEYIQFAREAGRVAWAVQKRQYEQGKTLVVSDATGQELKRFEAPAVLSLLLSNDGKRLAIGGHEGSLRVYEAETGKLERTLLGNWPGLALSAYADGGKLLRTIHTGGVVHDFDANTGKHLAERKLDLGQSKNLITLSADGALLATATDDGTATVWDLSKGAAKSKPKAKLFAYREPNFGRGPFALPPLPPGPVAPPAAPGPNDEADGADGDAPPPPAAPPPGGIAPPPPIERPPGPPQFAATFSPDGKLFLAVTGEDNEVTVWDSATGEAKQTIKVPKATAALAVSANGAHLFTATGRATYTVKLNEPEEKETAGGGLIRRYDLKSGKQVQGWKAPTGEKRANLKFERIDVEALYPLADKETLLVAEAEVYQQFPPPPGPPGGFGLPPEQRFPRLRLVNLPGREKDRVLPGAPAGPTAMATDGKSVCFLAMDAGAKNAPAMLLKVVEGASGKAKGATVATAQSVAFGAPPAHRGVNFRPGSADIAVRTGDGTVLVLDAAKLKELKDAKPEMPDGKKE